MCTSDMLAAKLTDQVQHCAYQYVNCFDMYLATCTKCEQLNVCKFLYCLKLMQFMLITFIYTCHEIINCIYIPLPIHPSCLFCALQCYINFFFYMEECFVVE